MSRHRNVKRDYTDEMDDFADDDFGEDEDGGGEVRRPQKAQAKKAPATAPKPKQTAPAAAAAAAAAPPTKPTTGLVVVRPGATQKLAGGAEPSPSPSPFARALLERDAGSVLPPPPSVVLPTPQQPTKPTTTNAVTPFDFSTPSPDDLVEKARARGGAPRAAPAVSAATPAKPPPASVVAQPPPQPQPQPQPPATTTTSTTTTTRTKAQQQIDDEEDAADALKKPQVSLVVVGHVDAGKSTLMGHLLSDLGLVSQKEMHKLERESRELGKASFKYAFVMDVNEAERRRGVTVDVGVKRFETPSRRVVLLDAPGHRDFVPNMIQGAAQADAALLVVPATLGEFESSFVPGAQTREHAVLVSRLGVSRLVVAVNKMDAVGWDQARFEEIRNQLVPFLTADAGYAPADVVLVPVSGLSGDNLSKRGAAVPAWYDGPTVLQAIDALPPTKRPVGKPLRLVVSESGKVLGAITVWGRIEAGVVRVGDRVALRGASLASKEIASVKMILSHGDVVKRAKAGDNVELTLSNVSDEAAPNIDPGTVVCDPDAMVPLATKLKVKVLSLPLSAPTGSVVGGAVPALLNGSTMTLHTHAVDVPCTVTQILSVSPSKPNAPPPRVVRRGQTAELLVSVAKPVCVETFDDLRPLSRLVLRSGDVSVAAGVVTAVEERL